MKTQGTIINTILLGIATLRNILTGGSASGLQWVKQIASFKFSWSTVSHYILPLLKSGLKEAMGYEVEIEVLLLLIVGYLVAVKTAVFSITSFNPFHHTDNSNCYGLCA